MKFNPLQKRIGISVAVLALAAGVVAGRERPSLELLEERASAPADDGIDLGRLRRGEATLPQKDPFASRTPAPVAVHKPAENKPLVPPLPFQYFGRLTENGKTEVFLMRGEELLSVAAGQKLGDYRVDKVSDARISFTYLPLKTRQTLDLQ